MESVADLLFQFVLDVALDKTINVTQYWRLADFPNTIWATMLGLDLQEAFVALKETCDTVFLSVCFKWNYLLYNVFGVLSKAR